MTITQEQSSEIKKQIISQVKQMPNDNSQAVIEHINNLDEEGLEEFLKQNNIEFSEGKLKQSKYGENAEEQTKIFGSIISGKIPSFKIAENDKAIAILEINPLSKGHSLVLPKIKTSGEKIPKSALTLAQKIGRKIKSKLKANEIKIETFSFQDYPAINIIPIYKDKALQKYKEDESELNKLKDKLETKKRTNRKNKEKIDKKNILEFKSRLPY